MSVVLHPQNSFTVVRQIANHLDAATYYVRAVIRNAYTDEIIETLDLTDRGSQRFSKNWQVPPDPSGQGFYVSIVTSVYTDGGYTTKSENYGDEETTYLVQDRVLPRGGGGIDAFTVRRIFREELDKLPKPEAFDYDRLPKPQEYADRTDEILDVLKRVEAKEPEKIDLSGLYDAIADLKEALDQKPVTPATDLEPVLDLVRNLSEEDAIDLQELKDRVDALTETLQAAVYETIKKAMGETEFTSTFSTKAQPKAMPEDKPQFDVSKLTQ